ncbi:MAG: helix-turn-helix domain-containing protein, partial [Rectinemataceae bacterium]
PAAGSAAAAGKSTVTMTMEEVQRQHILSALEQCDGRIHGPSGAAALLGMKPTTLQSRMKKLGIIRVRSFSTADTKNKAAE